MFLLRKRKTRYALIFILSLCLVIARSNFVLAKTDSSPSNSIIKISESATVNGSKTDNAVQNVILPVLDANGQQVSPGTLPTSPFYWLAGMIEKIQLFLTFDPAQKVALKEQQALQKLAAAREMVKIGKQDIAEKVIDDYSQNIMEVQTLLNNLKDPNLQNKQNMEIALAKADAANIPVLSQLLDKLPQQASKQIAGNILKSMQKDVSKLSGDQKKKVIEDLDSTTQKIDATNMKKQTQTALVNFQQTFGLTPSNDTEKEKTKIQSDNPNYASSNVVNGGKSESKENEAAVNGSNRHSISSKSSSYQNSHENNENEHEHDHEGNGKNEEDD